MQIITGILFYAAVLSLVGYAIYKLVLKLKNRKKDNKKGDE